MPIVDLLMREAENSLGLHPRSRSAVPAPRRPDSRPESWARERELPGITDEADALFEPTLIAEPPPDSIKACISGEVEGASSSAIRAAPIDDVDAVANDMICTPVTDEGALPKLSSEDDGLLVERRTELMVVAAEPASLLNLETPEPVVRHDWTGGSMTFDPHEDRRRDLVFRAAIALGAFVITAGVLLWMFLG